MTDTSKVRTIFEAHLNNTTETLEREAAEKAILATLAEIREAHGGATPGRLWEDLNAIIREHDLTDVVRAEAIRRAGGRGLTGVAKMRFKRSEPQAGPEVAAAGGRLHGVDFRVYAIGDELGRSIQGAGRRVDAWAHDLGDKVQRTFERAALYLGAVDDALDDEV